MENRRANEFMLRFSNRSTAASYKVMFNRLFDFISNVGGPEEADVDFGSFISRTASNGDVLYRDPIDRDFVRAFIHHRMKVGDTLAVLRRHRSALKAFCEFLKNVKDAHGKPVLVENPVSLIRIPRAQYEERDDWLRIEEIHAMLKAAARGPSPHRDFALVLTMGLLGLRPGETVGLLVGDVEFHRNQIRIHNKTKKSEHILPLPPNLAQALRDHVGNSFREVQPMQVLFVDDKQVPFTTTSLGDHLRRIAAEAGIQRWIKPYSLRHSAATLYYLAGAALTDVQQLLDHVHPRTTSIYTHGMMLSDWDVVSRGVPEQVLGTWVGRELRVLEGGAVP